MTNGVSSSKQPQPACGEIAFIDLKTQQKRIRNNVEQRLNAVLDHGNYIAGPEIQQLEEELAARTGAKAAVACASGTAALIAPLLARGLTVGDAVFVPAFTYNATANAILLTGAAPIFVDIDPETFLMCPRALKVAIKRIKEENRLRPRAVIPVDLFGSPVDYEAISKITTEEGMFLFADGAQSFGGQFDGKWVGNLAPATAVSFFPGKSLGAYGDAGAMFTQDDADVEEWMSIRWHGTDTARKDSIRVGFNGRMDSFQATILLEKLAIFDDELQARHHIAEQYQKRLGSFVKCQRHYEKASSGYGYFSIITNDRDRVIEQLKQKGVPTAIYYRNPLHKMPAFSAFAPSAKNHYNLQHTDYVANRILSLPMHPYLTDAQVDYICDMVAQAVD